LLLMIKKNNEIDFWLQKTKSNAVG